MVMDYSDVAKQIKRNVGGNENIKDVTHCATRLRIVLKNENLANDEEIKKIKGVMGLVKQGGQYQIIIGTDVKNVFSEFKFESDNRNDKESKKKKIDILGMIAGCFTPIIPALTAAGMLSALLALAGTFGWSETPTFIALTAISNAVFYYLPILIGFSAAKNFSVNPYMGAFLGAILVHPDIMNIEGMKIFGMPITPTTYSSSVIPIILGVCFMALIEPLANKYSPKALRFFLAPLVTIVIVAPVTLVVLGPLGGILGNYLSDFILLINSHYSWLSSMLLGGLFPLLVMTGMHYAVMPLAFQQFASVGYNSITTPNMFCANIAQGAAGLAVAFKTKDKGLRTLAASAGFSGLLGVTEPVMYGVNIKLKRPFIAVMIGGAAGGLFGGIFGLKAFAFASPGLAAIAIFLGGGGLTNFFIALGAAAISFAVSFIMTLILGFDDPKEEEMRNESIESKDTTIFAPLEGQVNDLTSVNDTTFSEEMLGKGCAILPSSGKVVAPFDGIVSVVFPSKHAIGIISDDGVEVLIHIGLDTVKLNGQYFELHVKQGDRVLVGDELINFDIEKIKEMGLDIITPVIITNTKKYHSINLINKNSNVEVTEPLVSVIE